ncbi:MAG: hypothetical protein BAJATHORv1_10459 [Candidatus Thorarchaeota archaeon]|nr:MAG: hypothetical protein BAJATHORv1_10459 [Candidatus Thorarchaeota archaeon]
MKQILSKFSTDSSLLIVALNNPMKKEKVAIRFFEVKIRDSHQNNT